LATTARSWIPQYLEKKGPKGEGNGGREKRKEGGKKDGEGRKEGGWERESGVKWYMCM